MIRKRKNSRGFTMAELMIAVAIIIILAGVSFIGVNQYLESMALLERNGIAKEIFVAAQNHLTMAQGQGYLGVSGSGFGSSDGVSEKDNGLYTMGLKNSITNVMLPFGSIDETVRNSGNYYIRYQKESGRVLDVFYWTSGSGRFDLEGMSTSDFGSAYAARNNDKKQKAFKSGEKTGVLGWFGGEAAAALPASGPYKAPDIEVHNEDVLYLKVTNSNEDGELIVYVEGVESGTIACFHYDGERNEAVVKKSGKDGCKYIVLDDVANTNRLFSNIASFSDIDVKEGTGFIPGEDIRVYAETYKKDTIAGVGRSSVQTTNSLFQSVETKEDEEDKTKTDTTIYISNFRHLENLYDSKSKMDRTGMGIAAGATVKAEQTEDLFWNTPNVEGESDHNEKSYLRHVNRLYTSVFEDDYTPASSMVIFNDSSSGEDYYVPVSPSFELAYEGAGYAIWDVNIHYASDAGLFGNMTGGSLSNLELINFNVTSTGGNAGALAGSLTTGSDTNLNTQVTNVVAYNTARYETTASGNINTSGDGKAAGGLIGSMSSTKAGVKVNACAASLYVNSTEDAGGLIGQINGPLELTASYSGGHTVKTKAKYYDALTPVNVPAGEQINVIGGRNVGGLVGSAVLNNVSGSGKIEQCYSTCSVYSRSTGSGLYAGGLVGQAKDGTIASCYCTGYVSGASDNAENSTITDSTIVLTRIGQFAGNLSGISMSEEKPNWYYSIINERADSSKGYCYLSPVGNETEHAGIKSIDETVDTYNNFTGTNWAAATPYDSILGTYYQNKYPLKTVKKLGADLTVPDVMKDYIDEFFVETHYGDWPAPEIFVINES